MGLQQTQLAGAGYGFSAILCLQFAKDARLCPLTVLKARKSRWLISVIRKSLGNQAQHFQLALAQRLDHFQILQLLDR